MGDPAARKWMADKYNAFIKRNGIDCYRQDFNMGPLPWWEQNDEEGRRGLNENFHVQGYYAFWDDLLKENDGLLIDSCASGGRRNEYNTMKRSVPFHYTDFAYGDPPVKDAYTSVMFSWIPFFRNHTLSRPWEKEDFRVNNGNYAFHTAFAPCIQGMLLSAPIEKITETDIAEYKKNVALWRRAAKYTFSGDFYPLTPYSKSENDWCVWQFHDEEKEEGVLNAVRHLGKTAPETLTVFLKRVDEKALYCIDCPEGRGTDKTFIHSGKTLQKEGLTLTLSAGSGTYVFYHKIRKDL